MKLKVYTETWVSESSESVMFKEDMLPPTVTQREKFFLIFPIKFERVQEIKLRSLFIFDKLEEKRE